MITKVRFDEVFPDFTPGGTARVLGTLLRPTFWVPALATVVACRQRLRRWQEKNQRTASEKYAAGRRMFSASKVLAGLVLSWLQLTSIGAAYEPIDRMPAIDATQMGIDTNQSLRVGSRIPPSPFPPTGPNLDVYSPSQIPTIQQRVPFRDADPPYVFPQAATPAVDLTPPGKISRYKKGFFQKLSLSATWLDGGRVSDVGITELEALLTVALPLPTKDHPLLSTYGFETQFLEGPLTPDLPGQVYSAYAQFIWVPRIAEKWTAILGIEPGLYGDFASGDQDSFRLLGRGLIRYQFVPDQFEVVAGVLYLDRDDVKILPAGGVIWAPSDSMRYEIIFPKPKLAHRVAWDGRHETWVYLSGEFGGDSWAIQRASGVEDRLTLRDVRVMLGVERVRDGGGGAALEVGYVFSRTVEYGSPTPDVSLPATFLLRGVLSF